MINGAATSLDKKVGFPKISVVVPVHNSEVTIPELYCRVKLALESMGDVFEMVLVEDCSSDDSWRILCALAKFDERVTVLQLMKTSGKTAATLAGLSWAKAEVVVTLDDDLRYAPEDIPRLIHRLLRDEELDVVVGAPARSSAGAAAGGWPGWRWRSPDRRDTGFRAMRRQAAEALAAMSVPSAGMGAMIHSITERVVCESVRPIERKPPVMGRRERARESLRALADGDIIGPAGAASVAGALLIAGGFLAPRLAAGGPVAGFEVLTLIGIMVMGVNFLALSTISRRLRGGSRWVVRRAMQCRAEGASEETDNLMEARAPFVVVGDGVR